MNNNRAKVEALLAELVKIEDQLRDEKVVIVRHVAGYMEMGSPISLFSTRISYPESMNVTGDHVVLDAIRDIMTSWHNINHSTVMTMVPGDD